MGKLGILERVVSKGKMNDGIFEVIEEKKVKEIIDPETDVWEARGKVIISHNGVLKLAAYVGATWDEPRLDDKPREENGNGFYYIITCRFPDGTSSFETGEASDYNTDAKRMTLDYRYKQSMAIKRGMDRSFLRSAYMKMYDVYSEEEAEDFKEDIKTLKQTISKLRKNESKMKAIIYEIKDYIALGPDDEKYPNEYIVNIWKNYRDIEYLQELKETKKNEKALLFAINQVLREAKNELKKLEEEKEKVKEISEDIVEGKTVPEPSDEEKIFDLE